MTRTNTWHLFCADCGNGMHRSAGSLPQGVAKCHACRRANRPEPKPKRSDWGTRSWRDCEVCGQRYRAKMKDQRTCGRACGAQARAATRAERATPKATTVRWLACKDCGAGYTSRGGRRCGCDAPRCRVFITECKSCAQWFCSRFTVSTCSPICAERKRRSDKHHERDRRRALERDAFVVRVDRVKVYERDRWRCLLCGKPVKRTAVVPHPLAPTLDHIVPLNLGGLHEPTNCQTAHYLCNSRKGDRGGGEQLLLIG